MVDVAPGSNGLVSTFTMEMDDEASRVAPPLLLHSLSDVTVARLRRYHQQCNVRLEATLRLLRERQERERRSRLRRHRSPLNLPVFAPPRPSLSTPMSPVEAREWKLLKESSHIRVYRHKTRHEGTTTVQATGTIHGALEDVMNGLYADSTRTARVLEMLLSPRSLDARVLRVDKCSTETNPFQFAGIVWMALKVPGFGLCRHRDFLCFKKMDLIKDDVGEDMGYMVLHSIDPLADEVAVSTIDTNAPTGATWPPLSQSHHTRSRSASSVGSGSNTYVRGFISLAIVFKRVAEDRVTMFAHGQFNSSGRLPPVLSDNCIAEWLTSMANSIQSGQAKNLSLLLAGQRQPSGDQSKSPNRCGVCARSLFFWDAPRSCRGCWKPCCRTCRVTKPIFCAHYHPNGVSGTGGPCTEIFCLSCVCAVIPLSATINARLLKRLAKKRKRTPTYFRPTMTASSITDGSIPQQQIQSRAASEHAEILLAAAEMSSISGLSSRESEKHQRHRLGLPGWSKKHTNLQSREIAGPDEDADEAADFDATSILLEVLEHYQVQRGRAASIVSGMSSSNAGTSLRSFTSADLGLSPQNRRHSIRLGRYPSGHSLLAHNQSFCQPVAAPSMVRQGTRPLERLGSTSFQAQSSFWLPRQSALVKKSTEQSSPPRNEDYYQRLLQDYLFHTNSSRSLVSGRSRSSYGGIPGLVPPISTELWSDARAATSYATPPRRPSQL
ncbi:hypothetical protein PsorP6_012482 [Peronosclerospora sorghi]|uniref:Uncharacterized protein n=1 Tax=Peronosclerospora sorghi TaxID=230839 RepID=A0ACC0WH55_9STRA|nr:hypothetical protein PsorP6_012482 [Peronosclerospora sorghi]